MARRFLLVLLALGSVAGFAAGFRAWQFHREYGWGAPWAMHDGGRHDGRLDALADACVRAAERVHGAAQNGAAQNGAAQNGAAPAVGVSAATPPAP